MNAYVLLLLSNSKEIKYKAEDKHWYLSELMVSLVFQWAALLERAVHYSCSAQHGPGRGLLSHWGKVLALTGMSRTCSKAQESQELHQTKQHQIQLLYQMIWRELDHIWHRHLLKTGVLLYQKKLTLSINDKSIFFYFSWETVSMQAFSKSSALELLWMVNKNKKWICLIQHIRWPCKTCLHCYNFANELSTLLIKNCIFCCKSVSVCTYISIYISINKCVIYSGNLAVQKFKENK